MTDAPPSPPPPAAGPQDEPWPRGAVLFVALGVGCVALSIGIAAFTLHATAAESSAASMWERRGQVGDFFGGHLAGFGNLASFFIVFAALLLQSRELGLQRHALNLQREELEAQRHEFTQQTAELRRNATEQHNAATALARAAAAQEEAAAAQSDSAKELGWSVRISVRTAERDDLLGLVRQLGEIQTELLGELRTHAAVLGGQPQLGKDHPELPTNRERLRGLAEELTKMAQDAGRCLAAHFAEDHEAVDAPHRFDRMELVGLVSRATNIKRELMEIQIARAAFPNALYR